MKMLIIVTTAFDKYLAQSSKNDNNNRKNSKTQPPSHHYLLHAYYVPGPDVRCSAYVMSVKPNNSPVSKNRYLHLR